MAFADYQHFSENRTTCSRPHSSLEVRFIRRLYTEVEVYMGIWIPRAKPEESKFTHALKTEVYNRLKLNSTLVPASYPKQCKLCDKRLLVCC